MTDIHIESVMDPAPVLRHFQPYIERAYITMYGDASEAGKGDPELFTHPRGRLWVAYADETPIGIAGWTRLDQLGYDVVPFSNPEQVVEIKRLYVVPDFRGIGVVELLDSYRLFDIFSHGYTLAVGETGAPQLASKRVHSKPPYRTVPPFGGFHDNEGSAFFGVTREAWLTHMDRAWHPTYVMSPGSMGSECER